MSKKTMRAKFEVTSITSYAEGMETLRMKAVSGQFDKDGDSEDNTYAKWTPSGELVLQVNNPALVGAILPGEKYYLDFTREGDLADPAPPEEVPKDEE